jgi:hypothetical protein
LISVPLVLDDSNVADFFPADMKQNITVVWAWDSTTQAYLSYTPQPGYTNNLTTVNEQMGLWVLATKNMSFSVSGKQPASSTVAIRPGWNLVGNPTTQMRNPASVYGNYTVVWGYEDGQYKCYTPLPGYNITLTSLKPGYGYWIYD